jgi:alkylation response protein AidB-like acyl-CoA dehydrogenase
VDVDEARDAEFRAEARAWLAAHAPAHEGTCNDFEGCRAWQRTLYDGGWAGVSWPIEFGGRGGTAWEAVLFAQEQARYDVSSGFVSSTIGMLGAALMAHGTDAQRERFLSPLLRGDEAWCQLFSEPGAGSDLANLATRAERDGDEFVVNGQKVWTSNAQFCDWAMLLARTNPDAPKHKGISFFLVDLRTPGFDIRPLRQITGVAHFNEVFLNDVRVPADNTIGPVDGGWGPARTVLANEAMIIGGGPKGAGTDALIELARDGGRSNDRVVRQRLAHAVTRERLLQCLTDRMLQSVRDRGEAVVDGSVLKVLWSEERAERADLAVDLLGPGGALYGDDAPGAGSWQTLLLNRFWGSIGGGTNEIHRTMVGERVLGLPAEPRVDKG